jgi:hypothetical protein
MSEVKRRLSRTERAYQEGVLRRHDLTEQYKPCTVLAEWLADDLVILKGKYSKLQAEMAAEQNKSIGTHIKEWFQGK